MYLLKVMLSGKLDAPSKVEVPLHELGKTSGEKQMFPLIVICDELHMHNSLMYILWSSVFFFFFPHYWLVQEYNCTGWKRGMLLSLTLLLKSS